MRIPPLLWPFLALAPLLAEGAGPVISELLADNQGRGRDDFGERSDWIEIHNLGGEALDLEGWALTDDPELPRKWVFPTAAIGAGGYRVVFASGRDRRQEGAPLHAGFRLSSEGEYLALTRPDGTLADEIVFPPQSPDISFGLSDPGSWQTPLLGPGSLVQARVPEDGEDHLLWRQDGYQPQDWIEGALPASFGYRIGGSGLDLSPMRRRNASVYLRIPFQLPRDTPPETLLLRLRYEDGFVAWLNGLEILRNNAPSALAWDSSATRSRPDDDALAPADFPLSSAAAARLRPGSNVLAVQGLNRTASDSDFLFGAELLAGWPGEEDPGSYHLLPTPGRPNEEGLPGVLPAPLFSQPGGLFSGSLSLELSLPPGAPEGASIRLTRDGSLPTGQSEEYLGAIRIQESVLVNARIFAPDGRSSPPAGETYLQIHPDLEDFRSELPLVVLENFRGGRPPQNQFQPGAMAVLAPGPDGLASLPGRLDTLARAGLKVRGSSTAGRPKPSLSIEARDLWGEDRGIAPLGLPREADWVLWGPYNFDLTLMHNPLVYELSRRVGRYASRTRFVEVFLNTGGGPVSAADYHGVYALIEKIDRDEDRVPLSPLFPEHDRMPQVSGGYMVKIDRADPGDTGFQAGGQTLRYVYPKETEIEAPERDPQRQFLRSFFGDMASALNGSGFRDPGAGYAAYIDVEAAIDHHLLNLVAFNVDAFRLSTYMHLPRQGKLTFGPVWDFDRALGSTDGRDANPSSWSGGGGTDFYNYTWWNRMFQDSRFLQRYIDRFQQLRRSSFSTRSIEGIADEMADLLRQASARDLQRWGQRPRRLYGGTWESEVEHMKTWLRRRIAFLERQFVSPPVMGPDPSGALLAMASPDGGEIWYTADGTDPLSPNGRPVANAELYAGPIPLSGTGGPVVARVYQRAHRYTSSSRSPPRISYWSGPASYGGARSALPPRPGDLALGELHHRPLPPSTAERRASRHYTQYRFQYLELYNASRAPLDLAGVRVEGDVELAFPAEGSAVLEPGEPLLLVADRYPFALRHGSLRAARYEYSGELGVEEGSFRVLGPWGEELLAAAWNPGILPAGWEEGLSLEPASAGDTSLAQRRDWKAGTAAGGSPGRIEDGGLTGPRVVISRIASRNDPDGSDYVELANLGESPALVGGWFLTDQPGTPRKYRIPEGTEIGPGESLAILQSEYGRASGGFPGFALSAQGEEIHLFSAIGGDIDGHPDGFAFPAAGEGEVLGRWEDSRGGVHLAVMAEASPGGASGPAPPRLAAITEAGTLPGTSIRYLEVASLQGPGSPPLSLAGWRLEGGLAYQWEPGAFLEPGQRILVLSADPGRHPSLESGHGIPPGTVLAGPYQGRAAGLVQLERPDPGLGPDARVAVDIVRLPETEGAVQRSPESGFGREPASWRDAPATPGGPPLPDLRILSLRAEPQGILLEVRIGTPALLQAAGSLDRPWETLQALEPSPEGLLQVADPSPPAAQRFYRLVPAGIR